MGKVELRLGWWMMIKCRLYLYMGKKEVKERGRRKGNEGGFGLLGFGFLEKKI